METTTATLATLYTLLLGPFKLIGPFATATANADPSLVRLIAFRAASRAFVISVVVAALGGFLMSRLQVPAATLTITMGLFLAHWAFRTALAAPGDQPAPPEDPTIGLAVMPVAVPLIIPPQGVALLVVSSDLTFEHNSFTEFGIIMALIAGVMTLNWVAMLAVRTLMRFPGPVFLAVVSRIVAVLVSAMALQLIVRGIQGLDFGG